MNSHVELQHQLTNKKMKIIQITQRDKGYKIYADIQENKIDTELKIGFMVKRNLDRFAMQSQLDNKNV